MPTDSQFPSGHRTGLSRRLRLGALLACSATFLASCSDETGTGAGGGDAGIVARVGDSVITVADVETELQLLAERSAPIPDLATLVESMIERRLLVDSALADGLDQDPGLQRSWESLLIGRYKERHLREALRQIDVSDEEVAVEYEADYDRYRRPAKARLAILSLPFTQVMTDGERRDVVARMAEGRQRSLAAEPAGPGFGALAVNYSEDQVTRHRGGDTGWLDEGVDYRWPAGVIEAGFALPAGATSEPIETSDAVYLVRKLDERPASQIDLRQVSDKIRKDLRTAKIREHESSFAAALRDGVTVETIPNSLSGIEIPVTAQTAAVDAQPPTIR